MAEPSEPGLMATLKVKFHLKHFLWCNLCIFCLSIFFQFCIFFVFLYFWNFVFFVCLYFCIFEFLHFLHFDIFAFFVDVFLYFLIFSFVVFFAFLVFCILWCRRNGRLLLAFWWSFCSSSSLAYSWPLWLEVILSLESISKKYFNYDLAFYKNLSSSLKE